MNFGWIEASDPRTTVATTYAIDDACGGTPLMFVTYDSPTKVALVFRERALVAPGDGPYTCLVQQEATFTCAIGGTCRRDTLVDMTYDAFANVVESREVVTDGPTRYDYAPVKPNNVKYVVDLPMYRSVYQDNGAGALTLLHLEEFIYDGNTAADEPVGALGEVRTVRHWDSTIQDFLASNIEYDSTGLVTRTVDPQGLWVETFYDQGHHAFPERSCSDLGCVASEWDARFGVETQRTDLDNLLTRYEYDAHGRLVTTTTPDGGSTTTRILAHGTVSGVATNLRQRARVEVKDDSADGVLWTETLLDGFGRPYRTIKEGGATQAREYTDASDRPSRVSEMFSGASPSRYTTYQYDALGRATEQRAPDGSRRLWAYRPGEVDTIDELGRKRTLALDGRAEVTSVTERLNGSDVVTTYGYDAAHRLIGTSDHLGNTTSYYFDTLGQMIAESDPDRGLREYTYTQNGRLRTSTDAKGQRIEYRYGRSGRPVTRTDLDANADVTRTVQWTYDELPGAGTQGASRGRVVRVEDEQGKYTRLQTTFHYDLGGRVDTDERCIDGTCFTMNSRFDSAGRLIELTYPDANNTPDERVAYRYNNAGQLVQVGGYMVNATYTIDGLADTMRVGNGIETRWTRDPARRWVDSVDVSGTYDAMYVRDATGAIERLEEDAPTGKVSYQYKYDDLGRMTDANASNPQLDRHFTYDEIGRITSHSQHGKYQYDDRAHPHAVTSTDHGSERQYDANGNTTYLRDPGGREIGIEWTVDDRPARFDGPNGRYEMTYDVTGSRVKKSGPTSASYFHPYVTIENNEFVKYYFAGETLLARQEAGKVTYYHQDHVRAVRATTDDSGAVVNSYQFDAFGAPIARNTQNNDDVAFGTAHGDSDLDLVYMNARYYDPIVARFLSADSVVRNAFAPQSLDRYAYVEGDPVNYIDPSGHMRRDVELMKERKEMWRSLMVEFEKRSQEWCEPFCAKAITSTVVLYNKDGSIRQVWRPGDDGDLAMEAWAFLYETHQENLAIRAAGSTPTTSEGGGSGGGGGGCGPHSLASCGPSIFLKGTPTQGAVEVAKGGDGMKMVTVDQGLFKGTTVVFFVKVDKFGAVVDAAAECDGLCPQNFESTVKIHGKWVTARLTSENGVQQVVMSNGSEEKSSDKYNANMSMESTVKGEASAGGKLREIIDLAMSGSVQVTSKWGLEGTWDSSRGTNQSSTWTVTKLANVTSHIVILQVDALGPNPPKGIPVIRGADTYKKVK
jgi:RHS repeat-associated protein